MSSQAANQKLSKQKIWKRGTSIEDGLVDVVLRGRRGDTAIAARSRKRERVNKG